MTGGQHISQDDLALFAMQALSAEESAAVREHLSACADCRAELAMLEGDLAAIALSVEQHPLPTGARERFARRIAAHAAATAPSPSLAEPVSIDRVRPSARGAWLGWAAAAAILIAAIGLGVEVAHLRSMLNQRNNRIDELQASQSRAEQVLEVLTAPTAQRVVLTAPKKPPVPTGRAIYIASRGALIFQADNLPSIPAGKTYELWVIPANGSAPVPAGLFRPDQAGNGSVVLPTIPKGVEAKAFGVTMEDAAGSKTPTAPILLAGAATTGE